ncbi:hypothetical protein SAMD00019534_052120 [Acytostelium subglobosum LB1]|uniref:hypothetical protein n=1 Tax=Acytostelium subglobosum LB1 TaxID=1410327 RepID=UPI0006449341|nr:hypothetical protein SAMD00019534_052120 [Acytostelium subglobosum LB1]GAM22037.1 hypothetical protein SAMD00019534_052120 [Acytostelium subglobosum LB1]|eukprot:XP_012755137.1 hypothetical protein SAMD00019534_052120 [Acytostelium subglobosum LB1]
MTSTTSTTSTSTSTNNNNNNYGRGNVELKDSVGLGHPRMLANSANRIEEQYVLSLLAKAKDPRHPKLGEIISVFDKLVELAKVDIMSLTKQNFDYFHMFMNVLLELPAFSLSDNRDLHMMLLKKLNGLIFSNILVQTYCCSDRWIIKLLNLLIGCTRDSDVIGEISITLQILCCFNITPKELKYLFRLMESVGDERPFYWSVLVEVLEYILRPRQGPDSYFNFNQSNGGLMIPEKVPFDGGYTFSLWINVEDFVDLRYAPILYSFFTDIETGFECSFQGHSLRYSVKTKNKSAVQKSQFVFHPKRWYYITIAHEYFLFKKSQLSFFVNGKLEEKIPLLYPRNDTTYTRCHVGNSSTLNAGFIGRMGSILMVNEAMTPVEVQALYNLGKDYTLVIEKLPREGTIGIFNNEMHLESRKIKVLFMYYPKATDKALCFDISSGELPHAATMEGVNIIKTTSPIDQLLYVGGLPMIYPLFSQLGHPINGIDTMPADINEQTTITSTFIQYITIPNNSTHSPIAIFPRPTNFGHPSIVFRLLNTIIENNAVFLEQIVETQGFQTISFLLQSLPSSAPFWTPDDIETLSRLLSYCASNPSLYTLSIEHLIFRLFQLWSNTHTLTQMALFEAIRLRVQNSAAFWRGNIRVERWLEIMKRFYTLEMVLPSEQTPTFIATTERIKRSRSQIIVILRESCMPVFSMQETRWLALYLKESTVENQDDITKMLEDMLPAQHLNFTAKDLFFGELINDQPKPIQQFGPTQIPLPKHLAYLWDIDVTDEMARRSELVPLDEKHAYLLYRHWIKLRRTRAGNLSGAKVKKSLEFSTQTLYNMPLIYRLKELGIPNTHAAAASSSASMVTSTMSPTTMSPTTMSPATMSPAMSPSSSPPRPNSLLNRTVSSSVQSPGASSSDPFGQNATSLVDYEDTTVVRWKLDRSEGPGRMRRKLKRNYLGSDYKGLSKQNKFGRNRRAIVDIYTSDRDRYYIDHDSGDGLGSIIVRLRLDPLLDPNTTLAIERQLGASNSLLGLDQQQLDTSVSGSGNTNALQSPGITRQDSTIDKSSLMRTPTKLQHQHSILNTSSPIKNSLSETSTRDLLSQSQQLQQPEKIVGVYQCGMVTPIGLIKGVLSLTTLQLCFDKSPPQIDEVTGKLTLEPDHGCVRIKNYYTFKVKDLLEIHRRRYLLRWNAIEVFLHHKSYMFTFASDNESVQVFNKITGLHPPQLKVKHADSPSKLIKRLNYTQRWKNREISNFEYLMHLNTIAGRTYNDTSQYPIFPQVVADYHSEHLDLTSDASFRDLKKPIGALNQQRLDTLIQRYHSFNDAEIPPFLYGSHYSNFGIIAYYHVRLEPFTSYHLSLQSGVWDHPQRMFESVDRMWDGVTSPNLADVKELTPEFFYMPEFLTNNEHFQFGFHNSTSGDLILPPWAHESPELFIQKNREALESEYVSMHLNHWIDLIFGYKQKGQAAVEANNVFFHLTYEGNAALNKEDPEERRSVESQIKEFGQTPPQLFTKPHPKRKTLKELDRPQIDILTKFANLFPNALQLGAAQAQANAANADTDTDQQQQYPFKILKTNSCLPLVHIGACSDSDTIVLVYRDGVLAVNQFVPTPSNNLPFTFDIDKTLSTYKEKQIDTLFMSDSVTCISNCFVMTPDGKMLFSCANWDSIFKCCNIQNGKIHRIYRDFHRGMVTCISMGSSGHTLATASTDTTILVWDDVSALIKEAKTKPAYRLCSHDEPVHCIDINEEWDLIASGSQDRKCILHTLRTGNYVRTMLHKGAVEIVKISTVGQTIISYCSMNYLYVHSFNGKLLKMEQCDERLYDLKLTGESVKKGGVLGVGDSVQFLVTGGTRGVKVRSLPDLTIVNSFDSPTTIRTVALVAREKYMMIGLNDGNLVIIPFETSV